MAATSDDPGGELFVDWTQLGVDSAGNPIHVPTIEGVLIVCSCHRENCQLDRALFRARVSGFLQALSMRTGEDPLSVLGAG
jgi:hypothetical protein